ncbi:MAG: SHOCT domain-containing protein [Bifidobacterium crudilactis]|jgi:hypothetical protein
MEAEGTNATIVVENDEIVIHHDKGSTKLTGAEYAKIPLYSVASVKVTDPTFMSRGFLSISFMLSDGSTSEIAETPIKAAMHVYSLLFKAKQKDDIHAVAEFIRSSISDEIHPMPEQLRLEINTTLQQSSGTAPSDPLVISFKGDDGNRLELHQHSIRTKQESKQLSGVSARLETGQDLESRATITRLIAIGVFAFAAKKKTGGEKYVTIEGPDFAWIAEAGRKQVKDAMKFITAVNNAARSSASSRATPLEQNMHVKGTPTAEVDPTGLRTGDLVELAHLHDQGILTDEEFTAAKKKALGI